MRLETIRKNYLDGLLLRREAIEYIESIGKSVDFAERYLDGYIQPDVTFVTGVSHKSVLAIRG